MTILKALHHQAGVQNQGVQIKPDDETIEPMANVVFVGMFKRGRVDCPFKVTENNFRALLGYDPRNQVYQAIEDAFKTGLSHVWVQRVTNNSPWGDWALNSGVSITGMMARYTGYKTNGYKYFDSFADIDLTDAIIRSFHDADMQQWQAVKDAANQLTGVTNWAWDVANNQISYFTNPKYPEINATQKYIYVCLNNGSTTNYKGYTKEEACSGMHKNVIYNKTDSAGRWEAIQTGPTACGSQGCYTPYTFIDKRHTPYLVSENTYASGTNASSNPAYDPDATLPKQYVPFSTLAQKILSNTLSTDQGIALLAEVYIEAVANSIFNTNPSKQFVKLSDLIAQFEQNKILRT